MLDRLRRWFSGSPPTGPVPTVGPVAPAGPSQPPERWLVCESCTQRATLHVAELREGLCERELHFCEPCAHRYLYDPAAQPPVDHRPPQRNAAGQVRIEVGRVIISEVHEQQVVVLREVGGPRQLPIVIGIFEATCMDRRVKGLTAPRPLTHDGWAATITALGARVESVCINDLREHTYYTALRLDRRGERVEVDVRPSDGIVVALVTGAPLYIPDALLEAVQQEAEPAPPARGSPGSENIRPAR